MCSGLCSGEVDLVGQRPRMYLVFSASSSSLVALLPHIKRHLLDHASVLVDRDPGVDRKSRGMNVHAADIGSVDGVGRHG